MHQKITGLALQSVTKPLERFPRPASVGPNQARQLLLRHPETDGQIALTFVSGLDP